jgi:hypothetical protein
LTFKFIGCRKCEEAMAQNETPNFLFKMFWLWKLPRKAKNSTIKDKYMGTTHAALLFTNKYTISNLNQNKFLLTKTCM